MNTNQTTISGIINGDEKVLKGFYKDHILHVQKYILQNSGSDEDVKDIFQDALVCLYQKLSSDSIELKFSVQSYFYGICKNMWLIRLQKKRQLPTHEITDPKQLRLDYSIQDDIEYNERTHLYRKYFQKLSSHNKNLLTLYFEGKSTKEVAKETGYSVGYARKKKFEVKKQLLGMIEKDPSYAELRMTV